MEGSGNMTFAINLMIIALLTVLFLLLFYFIFKKEEKEKEVEDFSLYHINNLKKGIKECINELQNTNVADLNLNKVETKKREKQKLRLQKALRNCCFGDLGEKEFVKEYIKELLQKNFNINADTIDKVLGFSQIYKLPVYDKFNILLLHYKLRYGKSGFIELCADFDLEEAKENEDGSYYEIDGKDIEAAFMHSNIPLKYVMKLELIAQRIYEELYGLGPIDELRYMTLDGISAGVSGVTNSNYSYLEEVMIGNKANINHTYDSIWVFLHGKTTRLSFLTFGSQKNLERVAKNIYRYDNPGQLSQNRGFIVNDASDGARIVTVRNPFAESWAFFIRKFELVKEVKVEELITDTDSHLAINLMKHLIKGCQIIAITGEQGSGKTTLLKALVRFIDQTYTIRVQELVFETWLRRLYPNRNILTFRETDMIKAIDGINLQKKTDGAVNILGEIASEDVASLAIQLSQSGTKFTMFTHHAVSTDKLVRYFRNALLSKKHGSFNDECIAEEQVADAIHFDIHMVLDKSGKRYIERITEILPIIHSQDWPNNFEEAMVEFAKRMTRSKMFITRDIIVFEEDRYVLKNPISNIAVERIKTKLTKIEFDDFLQDINIYQRQMAL